MDCDEVTPETWGEGFTPVFLIGSDCMINVMYQPSDEPRLVLDSVVEPASEKFVEKTLELGGNVLVLTGETQRSSILSSLQRRQLPADLQVTVSAICSQT